jgi:hypothetical protein
LQERHRTMNRSRLVPVSLIIVLVLLTSCASPAPVEPTNTPTPPSADILDPMAGTDHDEGYGSHSLNVVIGVSGNGEPILNGYSSFEGSRARNRDKDAVIIVGIEELTLNDIVFNEGDIVIFVDDNTPEVAPPGTEIVINRDITILDIAYAPGVYVVSDDGTLAPAEE